MKRLELTHGSGAKTFVNAHGQLIHISLDGQYHLLAEEKTLSLKQLEEIVTVINRQGGRWNDPAVTAKVNSIGNPETASPAAPASTPPAPTHSRPVQIPETAANEDSTQAEPTEG